VLTEDFSAVVR